MIQPKKKLIIILTADAGFGHRKAAQAIAQAFEELYGDACTVEILNPLDARKTPSILRKSQTAHDGFSRGLRRYYGLGWQASRTRLPSAGVGSVYSIMLYRTMWDVVNRDQPDAIVTTYPLYQSPLNTVFSASHRCIPLLTVVTDLGTVHPLWFHKAVDACLVATPRVREQAINHGISPEKVHITGIPVNPELGKETREKSLIRQTLGWQPDLTTLLVVGSRRVISLPSTLQALNQSGLPLQLAIVAGGDQDLYRKINEISWRVPAHVYNWVDNLPMFMHASDCVISKAGGLIISESLACGLPILFVDALPDQERGNVEVICQGNAGELALSSTEVLEIMSAWLAQDGALLAQRAKHARDLGRPSAAYEVAKFAWQAAS